MELKTFEQAIMSGKPFRHYTMARLATPVWFEVHSDTEILVTGMDDILPMDKAVPLEWRTGEVFEIKDPK